MLQLKNINKSFFDTKNKSRKIKILEEINLEVKSKKILFLKGVNGSGKTTLLRIIGNLLVPDSGELIFENDTYFKKIRMVSNNERSFFLPLTVEENLKYFCSIFGDKYNSLDTDFIFKKMHLNMILKHRFSNISTGQKKITMLARALSSKPKLLLLDEFFSNLDEEFRVKIFSILKEYIKDEDASIIFTSHQNEDAVFANEIFSISDKTLAREND